MTNKYEAIGLEMLGDEERARAATVEFAAGTTPAQEAEAAALAQRTGAPVDAVRADPDGARKEAERRQLAALSPTTQRWLTENPNRYALVKDDVEQVNRLGLTISRTFQAARDFGLASGWRTLSDHLAEWDNIGDNPDAAPVVRAAPDPFYAEEIARSLFAGYERGLGNTGFVGLPDLRSAETRQAAESVARGLGYESDADYQAARTGGFIAEQERRAQQIERTSEATDQAFAKIAAANETDSVWEALGLVWEGRRAVGTVVGQSLGMGAPGLAMTAATGGTSRLATAATAGGSSGFVEYGASISEALSEAGVDVTDSRAVTAALRNPAIMEKARDRATKRGVTIGLFDAVTAGLAGQLLINARRGVSSAALRTAGEVGIQAGGGAAGELAAQVVAGDDIKLGDIILEGVAELPFAAVEGRANYVTARERGQVRWINEQLDIVRRSSSGAEALAAATAAAAESNLGQRSPAEAQAFARAAGAEGAVYIDADVARTLFQSDWQVLVDAVGGDAALTEQLAAGDVAIPADQYFGKIAQLPYAADIARNARVQADALSAVEMESFDIDALADALAGDTSEAAERATPGQPTTRQRVQEDVYGQLISTGRYTDAAAQAQAKLWGAFFASMESRYGADGWAAYEQRMRGIGTAAADGRADPRSTRPWLGDGKLDALLDAIRSGAGPSQSAIMGPSLSAFVRGLGGISDDTGELRGMDAGRLRIGLINAQGVPLDRAREVAAEAGYLPMDSDINDLLDLLDRDLRDGDVFSEQQADRSRVEFETAKSDLQAAIDDNDYLRALSNDEFRALTNQQIADALFGGSMMDQGEPGSFDNPLPESEMESAPVGAWVAGPALPGLDTRRQIMDVPLDRIDPTEFDSAGQLVPDKRAYAERYAEAMRAGEQFPNGRGSELPNGMIKLQDGHRRFAAARAVGAESMRLAVSPLALAQAANFDQPAFGAIPEKVRQAEDVISAAEADEDMAILYHSGDASIDAELASGIEPTFGAWLEEVLAGATDDEDMASAIREADPVAFYSESPGWVSVKAARAAGKAVRDITVDDIRQHGQLSIVSVYRDDQSLWRAAGRDSGRDDAEQAFGEGRFSLDELPFGVEPGDIFTSDAFVPDVTLTGEDLLQFIARNNPDSLREVEGGDAYLDSVGRGASADFDPSAYRHEVVSWAQETYGDAIAPNGRPVWQNFVAWFGDSQAVDRTGAPVEVFHGSPDARFMDADATFMSMNDRYGAQEGVGAFWFASSRATAASYADDRRAFDYQNAEPRIISAHLALRNPLVVDGRGRDWRDAQAIGKTSDVIRKAQDDGHDGVIIRNVKDDYNNTRGTAATDTYVVFNSRQIKSSQSNSGNFAADRASILEQRAALDFGQPAGAAFDESVFRPAVVSWAKERFGDLVAPNGRPAWQNFVAWFGDSKMVDSDGRPLVTYHSTTFGDFDTFNRSEQRKGMAGFGFYFSDQDGANIYADYGMNFQANQDWRGNPKRVNVMPSLLAASNPLVVDNIADVSNRYGKRDPGAFGTGREFAGLSDDALTAIERDGYDGVIANEYVKRQRDGSYKVVDPETKGAIKHPVYVVFQPNQIKSATGNTGAFDPSNPSILNQGQSAVTDNPAFRRWFGDSKVVDADGRPLVVYHGTRHDFTEFKGEGRRGQARLHYFAADPGVASEYAGQMRYGTPNVMPAYVSLQSPYVFDADGAQWGSLPLDMFPPEIATHFDERSILRGREGTPARIGFTDVIRGALAAGYDGVIADNIRDGAGPYGEANPGKVVVASRPTQIKSATGNSGAFDPSNPNILFQPAFHGTPHDVDRFSLQRIGTGEGNQAFGWGLYFASQRDVADFYRRNLTGIARNIPATMADDALRSAGGNRGRAVADLARRRDALPEGARGTTQAAIEWLRRGQGTGRLYEVDVPEDSDLLDYDKPLSEQPEKVRAALEPVIADLRGRAVEQESGWGEMADPDRAEENITGQFIYRVLADDLGPQGASQRLLELGIPGLRYLDGDSRGSGGTHNYVIWDESAISEPVRLFQSGDAGTGVEANPNFRRWSNDATLIPADRAMDHEFKSGQKVAVQAYHGTKRPDRIGEQFRRARATSGPMAFFTSDPAIASNYATGKNDTSIDLEENPFESWFKFKPKGERTATDIIRAWHFLTPEQKDRVAERAPMVRMDDEAENIILDEDNTTGVGNYDYELQLTQRGYDRRGNPLKALVEGWLNGGTLYDQESRFMEVLELAGFPVEDVTFDSPYAEFPSVYPVYLAMQSPLVTNDIPQDVVDALNAAAKRDRSRAKYESGVDAWDKNTRTLREWVEQFNEDDSFVWTSIPDKVTKLLADMGYDGIIDVGGKQGGETHRVYIPFGENQVKSQFNRGTFGDTRNIMRQGGQQAAPRGQIQIYPDRSMAISLFETANRSTFLHETGHFFLEVLRDMAAAEDAPQQARDDMAALLSWFGVESADQIAVEHHEQFARGFEKYLGEGRAPSPELQSAFSQFKAWLLSVYRSLVNLNVNLTDDVRGVMDRMLAADEEIEAAHVRQGMEPLAFADGVLEEAQIRQYAEQLNAATERERAALAARLMAAHDRAARRWYKEQKAEVRKEVEAEYSALPVYRAARALAGAKTFADGTPIPDELRGMKLDRDALVAVYGEAYLQRIRGLYAREGGVDQDVAAMRLGFESGDALLNALANREDMAARVTAETDARMVERYGDPMVDGTLPERAMEAVHGDHRMRVLAWEMAVLEALAADPLAVPDAARPVRSQEGQAERPRPQVSPETRARIREAQGRRTAATRALAEVARRSIAKKTLRDIRPNDYLVAERKAAVKAAAASARGNYAEALQAKRQQAFNAAMYRQAKSAQSRAESNVRFLRKASSDATRARIGKQAGKFYVDALDAIFHGIEVRGVSRPQVARRAALRDWVRRMQDEGNSTAVPEMLLARVESENVTNLADMTVGDVEGLREAVGNILHLARTKNRLLTAKGQRDWEDVKAEMMARLEQQPDRHGRAGISDADRRLFERIADLYAAGSNWVLQPETMVEWLDGGTTGPFHDLLWDQAQAAERKREALNRAVGGKLQEALDALPAADRKALDRRFHVESLGGDVSGHSILSALLNMGNAGNRDKLTRGGRVVGDEIVPFTPEQLADMFAKLTRPQAEMVQKVWDAIDTLWPEIVALEESMNGIAPERVESTPVTVITRDGPVALRGGYYPAMYDPKGARAGQFSEDEQAKRVLSGQTPIRASTSKGHTEKRTDFTAPLLLDYQAVLTRHLDGVIGDIAYRQFLRQVYKVLGDADIRRMIDNRVGPGAAVGLRKGFERGATGNFSLAGPLLGPFQRVADAAMTNLSSAALGFRIPLALANVVAVPLQAAARVPYRYVLRGLRDYYLSGGANLIGNMRRNAEMVQRLSPLMLRRSEARSVELSSIIANLRGQRGFRAKMIEMAMSVHQWTVPLAENAIWMGAYQQAADAGATPTEAVTAADKAIRQTQTKTSAAELSQGEGGYMRMFMQFAGPLVIMNNRMQEAGLRGLRGDVHSWPQALGVWFAVAMGAAWSFELIMGRGPDADDDGEDPDVVDWVAWAAKKLALLPFAAFPMVRDAASYLDSGFSRSTPLVESMKSVIDTFGGLAESLFGDEEVDAEKVTKQAVRAAGVATGVPSNQLLRTGDYLMSVSTGEHEMGNPAAEAYYLVQGAPDED